MAPPETLLVVSFSLLAASIFFRIVYYIYANRTYNYVKAKIIEKGRLLPTCIIPIVSITGVTIRQNLGVPSAPPAYTSAPPQEIRDMREPPPPYQFKSYN